MPETLSCILVPTTPPTKGKISWKGITVGISTFEDVRQTLAPKEGDYYYWDTINGNMRFLGSWDADRWSIAETCFVNNQLSAISILNAKEFLKPIAQYIKSYGNPDIVTWGNSFNQRSLLWAEKGLLVTVIGDYKNNMGIGSVILFPPVPRCDLLETWIYLSLPEEKSLYSGDAGSDMPNDIKDPWGIEKRLGDCPH